jgi:predicted ATPase
MDVARLQQSRAWELRAAIRLARALTERDRQREAHDLLVPVYDWFSEGFDTPDLRGARALLDELESTSAPSAA